MSPLVQPVLRQLGLWPTFLAQGFAPSHRTLTSWDQAGLTSSELLLEARGPSWRVDRRAFDGWLTAAGAARPSASMRRSVISRARRTAGRSFATTATAIRPG
ncbi:hypothetical protein ACQ5SK_43495 [Bradyrhizobium japonicum]